MIKHNYVAIDFETANKDRVSACSIGIAILKGAEIVETKHYYIKPPSSQFDSMNISIHGITYNDVKDSPTFDELWDRELKKYFTDTTILLHNASMDASVLRQLFDLYSIDADVEYIDTMRVAKKNGLPGKLVDLCFYFNLPVLNHHNAEADAVMCANIFFELNKEVSDIHSFIKPVNEKKDKSSFFRESAYSDISEKEKKRLEEGALKYEVKENEITEHTLKEKKIVVTGTFSIARNELKKIIENNGARNVSSISKKTDYVILGSDAGPAKMEKIEKLNSEGANIVVLTEEDFFTILENADEQ